MKKFLALLAALAVAILPVRAEESVLTIPSAGAQVSSLGLANKLQVLTTKGTFGSVLWYNTGGIQYLQIHFGATAPTAGAVPFFVWPVASGEANSLTYPTKVTAAQGGLWIVNSSTRDTYTAGSADCWLVGTRYQ